MDMEVEYVAGKAVPIGPNRAQRRAMDARSRADLRQSNKELLAFKRAASEKTGVPVEHMVIVARGDELMVFDKRQPWDKLDAALEAAGYDGRPDIIVVDDVDAEAWKPAEGGAA